MPYRRLRSLLDRPRRSWTGIALLGLALSSIAGGAANELAALGSAPRSEAPMASQETTHMWMSVGTQRFAVTVEDNPTARALVQLLPVTLEMAELNGNEKHGRLPRSLPVDAMRPGTIRTGDVLLYGNDTLVVFYQTFRSSYSYTRIGRIAESAGLAQAGAWRPARDIHGPLMARTHLGTRRWPVASRKRRAFVPPKREAFANRADWSR